MRLDLRIELGDAAMQTPADVAGALRRVAARLDEYGAGSGWAYLEREAVRDENGNACGGWEIDKTTPETIRERYSLEELEERPTLSESQTDNLKIDTGTERVWLSRGGLEDGEPFEHAVTVERLEDGCWVVDGERYGAQ